MRQTETQTTTEEPTIASTSVFRNRHFMLLWLAQAVSQTAQNAIWYGLMVVVEEKTHSSTQMGFAILSTILPSIMLGLVAGVLVDRFSKKSVLVATNFMRALVVLGYLFYGVSLAIAYLVNFASSLITQFFAPAEASKIPQLVSQRQLLTANSLFNLTFNGAQLAGMVLLGPPLVKFLGPEAVFIAAAGTFAVAGVLVSQLPREIAPVQTIWGLDAREVRRQVWGDIVEGWRFITADRRTSLAMLHLTMASALMLIVAMLAPRYVVAVLQIRADDAVYILAPAGLGILLGTTTIGNLARHTAKEKLVNFGLVLMSVFIFLLAIVRWLADSPIGPLLTVPGLPGGVNIVPFVMLVAGIVGFAMSLLIIPSQTILMERAPASTRGRIFAVQIVLGNVASIAPLLFIGELADRIGISQVVGLLAVMILVIWAVSTEGFAARLASRLRRRQ